MSRETVLAELEQFRRSVAMLPPGAPLSRETAIALIERCQRALAEERSDR